MSNKYFYISNSETGSRIEKEITDAKGSENVINFLTTKDLKDLAQKLITRQERASKCTVFELEVKPIHDMDSSNVGSLALIDVDLWALKIKRTKEGSKKISVIVPDEAIFMESITEYLFKLRKKPLIMPLNYLYGMLKQMEHIGRSVDVSTARIPFPKQLLKLEILAVPADKQSMQIHTRPGETQSHIISLFCNGVERQICRVPTNIKLKKNMAIICEDI